MAHASVSVALQPTPCPRWSGPGWDQEAARLMPERWRTPGSHPTPDAADLRGLQGHRHPGGLAKFVGTMTASSHCALWHSAWRGVGAAHGSGLAVRAPGPGAALGCCCTHGRAGGAWEGLAGALWAIGRHSFARVAATLWLRDSEAESDKETKPPTLLASSFLGNSVKGAPVRPGGVGAGAAWGVPPHRGADARGKEPLGKALGLLTAGSENRPERPALLHGARLRPPRPCGPTCGPAGPGRQRPGLGRICLWLCFLPGMSARGSLSREQMPAWSAASFPVFGTVPGPGPQARPAQEGAGRRPSSGLCHCPCPGEALAAGVWPGQTLGTSWPWKAQPGHLPNIREGF